MQGKSLLKVTRSTILLYNHNRKKSSSPPFLISGWASKYEAPHILRDLLLLSRSIAIHINITEVHLRLKAGE